jgi:hypothetical protein
MAQVQTRLAVGRERVRYLASKGQLVSRRYDGRVLFDPASVERAAAEISEGTIKTKPAGDGQLASRAFTLFGEGIDLRRAVVELRQPLAIVEALARDYAIAGSEVVFLLRAPSVERLRAACAWQGSTEQSLIDAIEKLLHANVDRRDQRLEEARLQLAEAEVEQARLARVIAERDVRVRELEADVAGYEKVGDTLRTSLREKRAQVAALEDEVSALRAAAAASAAQSPASPDGAPDTPASAPAVPIAA